MNTRTLIAVCAPSGRCEHIVVSFRFVTGRRCTFSIAPSSVTPGTNNAPDPVMNFPVGDRRRIDFDDAGRALDDGLPPPRCERRTIMHEELTRDSG